MAEVSVPPVASAGNDLALRSAVRWLLLVWTLLGLAVMHTLGHGGHAMAMPMADHPAVTRPLRAAATALAAHTAHIAMSMRDGCPDGCSQLGDGSPTGGGSEGWSVCLAILAALAVVVLLGWLLKTATRPGAASRPPGTLTLTPRAPPPPHVGPRLAELSVVRR
jgi:hypothetical protein